VNGEQREGNGDQALEPRRSLRLDCRITSTKIVVNESSITNAAPSPVAGFAAVVSNLHLRGLV
jgi:hypothetical protein